MTFENLADMVRKDYKESILLGGFKTFKEMAQCYGWDAQDIKEDVNMVITDLARKAYANGEFSDFWMADDNSFIQIGVCEDMSWRDFKKLVFANL